jgi:hypothetical protein
MLGKFGQTKLEMLFPNLVLLCLLRSLLAVNMQGRVDLHGQLFYDGLMFLVSSRAWCCHLVKDSNLL